MAKAQATKIKPNKFNEIFSTANRFLGPARGENPFVKKPRQKAVESAQTQAKDETAPSRPAA